MRAARLLSAAAVAAIWPTRRRGGRFGLGALGAALLGNPGVAAMVEHHAHALRTTCAIRWRCCAARPARRALAATGPMPRRRPAALPRRAVAAYTALMAASQPLIAERRCSTPTRFAAPSLPARSRRRRRQLPRRGRGARTRTCACVLFDLPPVAERARGRFAAAGLADRASGGRRQFPDRRAARGRRHRLAGPRGPRPRRRGGAAPSCAPRAARCAPGGTLLVAEPMAGTPGAEPIADAYFAFYLLAMGSGRPAADELGALLRAGRLRPASG